MQQRDALGSAAAAPAAEQLQLLCVDVADHRCALPLEHVLEIHPAVQLEPLPDAPDVVLGLLNRRGQAVPVLGLRCRLGLPARSLLAADRLVVLQLPDRELALLVDAALDIVTVPSAAVDEAVPRAADAVRSQGVAVLPDGLLVVLDVEKFLSSTEVASLDAALHEAARVHA